MPTNILRGDAPARQQITVIGPPTNDQLDGRFEISINGKTLTVDGWDAGTIVSNWPTNIPEFAEISPIGLDGGAVQLTGLADGTPFYVSVASTAVVEIAQIVAGKSATTEVQRITIPPASAGTFTVSYPGGFTSAAIAYDASAATVETALNPIEAFFSGVDITVTGDAGGPWDVHIDGAGEAAEMLTVDVSGLTLDTPNMIKVTTTQQGSAATGGTINLSVYGFCALSFSNSPGTTLNLFPGISAGEVEAFLNAATGATWTLTSGGDETFSYFSGTSTAPTIERGDFVLLSIETPPGQVPGSVGGSPGKKGVPEIQTIDLVGAGGGTFTLTVSNSTSQVTGALAWNITPDDLATALVALSNVDAVFVTGVAGDYYEIAFTAPAGNYRPTTFDAASLTGAALVTRTVAFSAGANEVQRITLPGTVSGGTFLLSYEAEETAALAYNVSAASMDTALEGLAGIGASGVTVAKDGDRAWQVTFSTLGPKSRLQANSDGLTNSSTAGSFEEVRAGGPTHWNDPLNWTLGRPPESGDTVWLDQSGIDILHSLRQRTGFTLGDSDKDTLQADGDMHFAQGQKITLRTTDTLPGGLNVQDYYVADPDEANRTFKLSTTRGGAAVDLTSDAGTGTHTALVELDAPSGTAVLNPTARFSGKLGLPRRNPSDYWEYRPLSLAIGVRATGSQLVRIGAGDGPGSGRLKIDLGSDEAEIRVLQTAGSAEGSVPACLLTISNNAAAFIQHDGDSGLAFFPEDAATIGSLDVRGGSFSTGDNVTIEGAVTAIVGSVRGRYLDASGNSHRWE